MEKIAFHDRKPFILPPGGGRTYAMGRISSTFKADSAESAGTYSVSEWWMEPNTKGPGAHAHEDDHVYYVLDGTMSISLEGQWHDCPKGSCIIIPGGTKHDFENRSVNRSGILSFNNKAGFETHMPSIVKYFATNPPGNAL
jgi:mannose-6-phosphate isomerase-like protein (cupin superfamily)